MYHVTSRGNERQTIYRDEDDFARFLAVLMSVCERFNWVIHSYCLMTNHYHLLVETPDANLAKGMRQLNGVYTQQFNRKYQRVGHLFQGRYKSILVDKDSYLLELCRYIVLNPVREKGWLIRQ
ncbi:transposase [Pseudoalteromonas xiamenensis]|uniref:transposase n=1 Tax=Pseudoalteromonas xiamenensis TaxID=882626 RepID=UPI0027E50F43|nr:transposase [Pseudoalteromonas xiamenensis]WMN60889.1 transposase [Pseudoalteromonas xiamenensis]